MAGLFTRRRAPSRASSAASLLREASASEEDAMEEVAGLVGASDATAMAVVGAEAVLFLLEEK